MIKKPIAWVTDGACIRCISHGYDAYGYASINRKSWERTIARTILARRLKCAKLPARIVARHTCDNRWCIRPDHIIAGTQKDNVRDRVVRGRSATGERNGQSKLSAKQVEEIRALQGTMSQREIGERFGIFQTQVPRILRGESRRD